MDRLKYLALIVMIGFLSIYHLSRIYLFFFVENSEAVSLLLYGQVGLRAMIVIALVCVAINYRLALLWMWLAIGALIVTQYIQMFTSTNEALPISAYMGYLRGLILPALITLIYMSGVRGLFRAKIPEATAHK